MKSVQVLLLVISVLIGVAGSANGQGAGSTWTFGGRAGLTSMKIGESRGEFSFERRTGLTAGVFATADLPGPFALQPELLYVQKGATATGAVEQTQDRTLVLIERPIKTSYLEFVALGKIRVPTGSSIVPTFGIGPTIGLNLRADSDPVATTLFGEQVDPSRLRYDPLDFDPRILEAGLVIGAGTDVRIGGVVASLLGRYRLGITNVMRGDGTEEGEPLLGPNQGFSVTTGVSF